MTNSHTNKKWTPDDDEAIELLRLLTDFAYEQGFHECGYDPVKHVARRLSENARLREACKNIAAYRVDRFFGDYAAMTSALQHEAVEALIEPENI